jgi:hypothetical protein
VTNPIIQAVHDREASLPGRPAQPQADPPLAEIGSTLRKFIGSNRSKSSNGSKRFERLEQLERLERNSQGLHLDPQPVMLSPRSHE